MKYNYQNDIAWKYENMQVKEDIFGDYGCLISSIANIYQVFKRDVYTPLDLLIYIKANNLFFTDGQGTTSLLKTDDLLRMIGMKRENILNMDYDNIEGKYYYAKVKLGKYNHYINVIDRKNNLFICYDVWDGKTKTYNNEEIIQLYIIQGV